MTLAEKLAAWYARMALRYAACALRYGGHAKLADDLDSDVDKMKRQS